MLAVAAIAAPIQGERVHACVSIKTEEHWLPAATMEVIVTTGEQLNRHIGRFKYQTEQHYAVLSMGQQGQLALPLTNPELGGLPQEIEEEEHPVLWRLSAAGILGCNH
jgi:hypothetical protein